MVALLILLWAVLRYLFTRPAAIAAHLRERRRQQGYDALSRGLLAIGVGDRTLAQRYAGIAGRNLPREPLTALLRAQTAQLRGDRDAAQARLRGHARPSRDATARGARPVPRSERAATIRDAARALAEQAVKRDPRLAWGVNALFDMQARAGDYRGRARYARHRPAERPCRSDTCRSRRRAVLLTAEARELEAANPDKALTLASEALRLAPSLVPAAEIAGRILASKGESRQASRLIARTWKLSPHPDLALVYAFAKPGEPPRERVKRVKYLASLTPGDVEGPIAVASAAIEAHEWEEAREALAPYLDDRPPARICTLMARIEVGRARRQGTRARMARARACVRRATAPGSPTAMSPTAGCRSRRSPAPSMPSNGRRRSMPSGAATTR